MKYRIAGLVILFIIAIQFIPYGKNRSNPPVVAGPKWDSATTRDRFSRSCADCHSHKTKWPWYSRIAPVSWLVQYDVDEAREHLNVSRWGVQKHNHGARAAAEVREGEMPLWIYLIGHPEARMSEKERGEFVKGLIATFGEEKEKSGESGHDKENHDESDHDRSEHGH